MLFKIDHSKDFFKTNPSAKAIPAFSGLDERAMKYIGLVYDYRSPIRQLPIEDRKLKAVSLIGFKKTPKGRPSKLESDLLMLRSNELIKAVNEYKEIQFDSDRDMLQSYEELLDQFKELMRKEDKSPKEIDQALKISKEFIGLMEIKKQLIEVLDLRDEMEEEVEEEEVSSLSPVEQFMSDLTD